MTDPGCVRWQGDLAMQALGMLPPEAGVGLQAHLDGCPACRAEATELAPMAGALATASPVAVADAESAPVSSRLRQSVLTRLAEEAARDRRRTRRRIGVVAAAASGVAAAAVLVLSVGTPTPPGRAVALRGAAGVSASITLQPSPSGTALSLSERGQPAGQDYEVSMESTSGTWWQAGSYHTSGAAVRAQFTCAVQAYEITRVWVRDASGATVLSGYVH